ncbi:efflux RND transporter periplasmic adaptor subunit [Desulfomonile tiedjei]|uniref:RND family efflux transporter, MFP subunit n=1 Tax=Desulfomonile tiedjei (strain ATCC 49306 / DSM 6799 / DCB-1) TaxID=706587 RepID=I4C9E6_DESTA|nr:efflux RND transporter periplasmic adaptor subunit [Desulfomonile tiedjei]AFM26187.1 RND family efflux transporter, MFP subunit [Desulfomonile tiedjei DSM 6799]
MPKKQLRRKHAGILVTIAIVILCGGAYWLNGGFSAKPQQEYETEKVLKQDVRSVVQATGIVKAMVGADVKVGARMPGKVVELPINVGDRVKEGQVIAKIEQDDLVAKVKLQKAVLAEARAEEVRLTKDFERDKQLRSTNSISPQKLDQSEAQHEMAKARTLKCEAELEYWESQLSYATIIAPIKGTVASVNTMQGETVVTGLNAPTFIRIIDLDNLEVLAYVDENDIGKVEVGQEAVFTVAAHQGAEFLGKVTSIYPSATTQDNVVYYITSVSVDNRGGKLRPDMTANVLILVDRRKGVLTVPHKAVQRDGNRKFVFVMNNGMPIKRSVTIGLRDTSCFEITDGLKEGELVVVGETLRK